MLPYLKKDAIKLGILSWEDYPVLSGWALNAITCILYKREAEGNQTHTEEKTV